MKDRWPARVGVLLILTVCCAHAERAPQCEEPQAQKNSDSFRFTGSPEHERLRNNLDATAVIGEIRVIRHNVFDPHDPEENRWLYGVANDFHSQTRLHVIERQLLFVSGDAYDNRLLEESERLLRESSYIYDAEIRPWRRCGNTVDVEVITRDTWTFFPTLSFSRSGGSNNSDYGVRDSNVFGTGKTIAFRRETDDERTGTTVYYRDPAILGSRYKASATYTDNDDGGLKRLTAARPFYAIATRWSAALRYHDEQREDSLYFRGDEFAEFDHALLDHSVSLGFSTGRVENKSRRWLLGYAREEHRFTRSDSPLQPVTLPENRKLSYPWIGFESVEDNYRTVTNLNTMNRTEDLNIGLAWGLRVGWVDESYGSDRNQLKLSGHYQNTLLIDERQLLTAAVNIDGFWDRDRESFENLWLSAEGRYHLRQSEKWQLFGRLRLDYTDNLTAEKQLTLGGDNGLRGYEKKYQVGNRSALFSIEQRYYSDWHPFNLVQVGLAGFFDVGRAWFASGDNGSNGDTLSNVGVGLRLASSRGEAGTVLHLDLAMPFSKDDDVDDYQWLATISKTF